MRIKLSFFHYLNGKKVLLMLFCIALLIYSNSLFNNFVADDLEQVRDNPSIHSIVNIPSLFFQGNFNDQATGARNNYYKPIFSTTLSLIYLFSAGNSFGFHLVQLLLHIINALLIYLIFKTYFKKELSFMLSLLFLVHPINTEAIVYISALQDTLFSFFGLTALYLVTKTYKSIQIIILESVLLALALLTKETGIVFLLMIPIFSYLYEKKIVLTRLFQSGAALAIYLILRFGLAKIYFHQNVIAPIMTLHLQERLVNIPKIILFYLKTFFYPKDLLMFQTWTVKSLNFFDFLLPLLLVATMLTIGIAMGIIIKRKNKELYQAYIFFSIWFLIGLGLHLQIIPIDQTVSDRWFYFPIVGLLGIVGVFINQFKFNENDMKNKIIPTLLGISILFSIRTVIRNMDWRTAASLYSHDVKYNPESYQLERGLGNVNFSEGNIRDAEIHYLKAVNLFPSLNTYYSLGVFYLSNERFLESTNAFKAVLKYNPNYAFGWELLAISKYKLGDKTDAELTAKKAYSLLPTDHGLAIINAIENNQKISFTGSGE